MWIPDAQQSCYTPDNKLGTCINIHKCRILVDIVLKGAKTRQVRSFLRQFQCGYEGRNNPKVCCPQTTTVQTPNSIKNRPNGGGFTQQQAMESSKLLPANCGIDLSNRIIGGTETELGEFPWLTLLEYTTCELKNIHNKLI